MNGNIPFGPFYPITLGQLVCNKREILEMTQHDVAYCSGLSRNEVSLVERDHVAGIKVATLRDLSRVLGLDITNMFRAWQESLRQESMNRGM